MIKNILAAIVTISGICLCYIDFYTNNHVQSSTLSFLGECLIWSGSMLGVKYYVDYKLKTK